MSEDGLSEQNKAENSCSEKTRLTRRDFLIGLQKWSKIVIASVVLGGALGTEETEKGKTDTWVNRRGSWGNNRWSNASGQGWYNSGERWYNGAGWYNGGSNWENRGENNRRWTNR
jgi:hypothetical protein